LKSASEAVQKIQTRLEDCEQKLSQIQTRFIP
jgi:hypothetical protein